MSQEVFRWQMRLSDGSFGRFIGWQFYGKSLNPKHYVSSAGHYCG